MLVMRRTRLWWSKGDGARWVLEDGHVAVAIGLVVMPATPLLLTFKDSSYSRVGWTAYSILRSTSFHMVGKAVA